MRPGPLTLMFVICLGTACQDDPGDLAVDDTEGDPVDGDDTEDSPVVEMLPEGADLELTIEGGEYVGYADCPDQGLVYVNIALTAPPKTGIDQIYLRSIDVKDTLSLVELNEDPGGAREESGSYVDAGSRETLLFSARFDNLPAICGDSPESFTGLRSKSPA